MILHGLHQGLGARFIELDGAETVAGYGDRAHEHAALRERAGVLDLSFRSRVCLTGADRVRFLHGQVTNDVKRLHAGEGCYAALVNSKGRLESDLNIFCLADELLLDFEPGLRARVSERLERYLVADDVQIVDVSSLYGLLSVQGPGAEMVLQRLGLVQALPAHDFDSSRAMDPALGEVYVANRARLGSKGFDLFAPAETLSRLADGLLRTVEACRGCACGWEAFNLARIEAGIPRFGVDMDEANFPQECGIEARAVSYQKGCYIGQEVLNRIHTIGHVNRELRGLRLDGDLEALPAKGDKLFHAGKEAGWITSAAASPALHGNIGLGYVRREASQVGTELTLRTAAGDSLARVVQLPFSP